MRGAALIGALLAIAAAAPSAFAGSSEPPADGQWYYCASTDAYYPWVKGCAVDWELRPAEGELPPEPAPPPWVRQMGDVGAQRWRAALADTAIEYREARQRYIEGQAQQARQAEVAKRATEARAADERQGLHHITLADLELDKSSIPATRLLVVSGMYLRAGDAEWLVANPATDGPRIGLITDQAPRDTRAALQHCRMSGFCSVTLIGHLGPCEHTFVGKPYKADRCLYVTGTR